MYFFTILISKKINLFLLIMFQVVLYSYCRRDTIGGTKYAIPFAMTYSTLVSDSTKASMSLLSDC